jgi:hypothetical protein
MNDSIIPNPEDILDAFPPGSTARRQIADLMNRIGENQIFVTPMNKMMTYKEYLAVMLWDLATEGQFNFSDGVRVMIEDVDQWLSVVKFIATHLDGPAGRDLTVTANVFKIYNNVDVDQI